MKTLVAALLLTAMTCAAQERQISEMNVLPGEEGTAMSGLSPAEEQKGTSVIIGTVIDYTTREPIAYAKISILGTALSAQSAIDGQYKIESIPEGIFQIKAEASGYESFVQNNVPLDGVKGKERLYFTLRKVQKELTPDVLSFQKEPPPDFVPVEKQPTPILNPAPVYPVLARRAGIEGTVWLKMWVDEAGKTRKAEVIRSDHDVLNQASIDAAMQWTFEPAMLNKKPVAVWVTVPLKFKLNDKPSGKDAGGKIQTKPAKKAAAK